MKNYRFGKRLLSVVLALAMMASLFSGLGSVLSASAATVDEVGYIIDYADAAHPNGTGDGPGRLDSEHYSVVGNAGDYSVTAQAVESYTTRYKSGGIDVSEGIRRQFRNWESDLRAAVNHGTPNLVLSNTNINERTVSFSFTKLTDFDSITVYQALYDTAYRVRIYDNDGEIDSSSYILWNETLDLPSYTGDVPTGKTFVAWKDNYSGILYASGSAVQPTAPMDFVPWFADVDEPTGYFVYFRDYTTNQIYDVVYFDPDVDSGYYTAVAPVKEGYTFDCWYTTDTEYEAEEWVPDELPAITTYYARWTPNQYEVYTQTSGNSYVNFRNSSTAFCGDDVIFKVGTTKANESITKVEVVGMDSNSSITYYYDADEDVYRFTMPAQDVVIKVETSTTQYTVTCLDENGGYYATRTVDAGDTLSFWEMPSDSDNIFIL